MLLLQVLVFGFTLWFGLYLLARDIKKPGLRFAGLGLATYALGLGLAALIGQERDLSVVLLLPSIFWMAATWYLLPETEAEHRIEGRLAIVLTGIGSAAFLIMALNAAIAQIAVVVVPLGFLLIALEKIRQAFRTTLPRHPMLTLLTATIFFGLGIGLMMVHTAWISREAVLLAISGDLVLLGWAIGYLDAYDEGTKLLPDALRSLAGAFLAALLFGGQVFVVMMISGQDTFAFRLLLFTLIATAVGVETFSGLLQTTLDRVMFADNPAVHHERRLFRSVNAAVPRINKTYDLNRIDEAEFARLTRRALSHYNDLDKLAASPLTQLPAITLRLKQNNRADNSLERTRELKLLLAESIMRLKPYSDKDFDSSEAWRYYNVLHFPYVRGLKPYSVRYQADEIDSSTQDALEWFQTQVPERTLYNWQTTAARLVAQYLRETSPHEAR